MKGIDLIKSALRSTQAIASGENPTSDEAADTLVILNQMLDGWSTERVNIFTEARKVFPLLAGQQTYQMGTGAPDFNTVRPTRIERASIISLQNPAQPNEIPIDYLDDAEWQEVPVKNTSANLPDRVWDDQGFPFRILSYYPIPAIACQTALYTWDQLTSWPDLNNTDVTFPPGYLEAIKYNLVLRCGAEGLGKTATPDQVGLAAQALKRIRSINIDIGKLKCDEAATQQRTSGRYNIYTDR